MTVRALCPDDWRALKQIRLKALETDGRYFFADALKDRRLFNHGWKELCRPTSEQCMFGLFVDDKLVGITMIRNSPRGPLFGGSYIEKGFRDAKRANALYEARMSWLDNNPHHSHAYVFHRAGNGKSRHLNKKNGGTFDHTEMMHWANGQMDYGHWYRLSKRPLPKIDPAQHMLKAA